MLKCIDVTAGSRALVEYSQDVVVIINSISRKENGSVLILQLAVLISIMLVCTQLCHQYINEIVQPQRMGLELQPS